MSVKHSKTTYSIIITDYKSQLRREILILILLHILFYIYVIIVALMLLFIEHCYYGDRDHVVHYRDRPAVEICEIMMSMRNGTLVKAIVDYEDFYEICNASSITFVPKGSCNLSEENLVKWIGFTLALCYTIGNGSVIPVTEAARIICIIFSIPGLTISITLYTKAGRVWILIGNVLLVYTEINILNREQINRLVTKNFYFRLFLLFGVVALLTLLTTRKDAQNLTPLEGVYFIFRLVTTVGFGGNTPPKLINYWRKPHLLVAALVALNCAYGLVASLMNTLHYVIDKKKYGGGVVASLGYKQRRPGGFLRVPIPRFPRRRRCKSAAQRQSELTHGLPRERRLDLVPYQTYADLF